MSDEEKLPELTEAQQRFLLKQYADKIDTEKKAQAMIEGQRQDWEELQQKIRDDPMWWKRKLRSVGVMY